MAPILRFALLIALAHVASAADIRFFLATDDPFAGTGRTAPTLPGNVSAVPGAALITPPALDPTLNGNGRLWVWATGTLGAPAPNRWTGIAVNVELNGPATISGGGMLNIVDPVVYRRWETGSDLTPPTFNTVAVLRNGVQFPVLADGYDDGIDRVLLGYLDVLANGGVTDVYLRMGSAGITRAEGDGSDQVFFGWTPDDFPPGAPEARVIPEPATGMLVLLAAGVLAGPRHHRGVSNKV